MARLTPQWQQNSSYPASVDRGLLTALWPAAASRGHVPTVVAGSMNLTLSVGVTAVPMTGTNGTELCQSDAPETVALPTPPAAGTSRIDLVCLQVRDQAIDAGANNDWIFSVVSGTAAASPTVPAVPANAVAVAQVTVPGGTVNLNTATLIDRRWPSLTAGTVVRQASNPAAGNAMTAAEVPVAFTATAAVWVPTATRLVTVRTSWRQANGTGGEGCILRLREGTTTAGTEIQSTVGVFPGMGPQAGTAAGGQASRTYAPGAGSRQWVLTVASTTGNAVTLVNGPTFPLVLEVVDAGEP